MIYKYSLILVVIILSGCASVSPSKFTSGNGKDAYTMSCSGFGRTLNDCYQAASKLCDNGYNVMDSPVAGWRQSLVVECK